MPRRISDLVLARQRQRDEMRREAIAHRAAYLRELAPNASADDLKWLAINLNTEPTYSIVARVIASNK